MKLSDRTYEEFLKERDKIASSVMIDGHEYQVISSPRWKKIETIRDKASRVAQASTALGASGLGALALMSMTNPLIESVRRPTLKNALLAASAAIGSNLGGAAQHFAWEHIYGSPPRATRKLRPTGTVQPTDGKLAE